MIRFPGKIALSALLMMACGSHNSSDPQANASTNVSSAEVKYKLPEDHRLHKDPIYRAPLFQEWLYFTGTVTSEGELYGYQITIFSNFEENKGPVYRFDFAISDLRNKRFLSEIAMLNQEDNLSFDPVRNESVWEYKQGDFLVRHYEKSDTWELRAKSSDSATPFSINLTLKNDRIGYLPESPNGIVSMGDCPQGTIQDMKGLSYYYSHPGLSTEGEFTIGSKTLPVSGSTWFDHQWGNFLGCPANWDWFSLRLDDGTYMMLFSLNKADNREIPLSDSAFAAYFLPDGRVEYRQGKDAFKVTPLRYVEAPWGGRIALDWLLETPFGTFGVKPHFDDQFMPGYYEGTIEVRKGGLDGELIGIGYQEH